jgi:hypothetical protein
MKQTNKQTMNLEMNLYAYNIPFITQQNKNGYI